jgi:hypothetical protein
VCSVQSRKKLLDFGARNIRASAGCGKVGEWEVD